MSFLKKIKQETSYEISYVWEKKPIGKYSKGCWFGDSWFFIGREIGWDVFWKELDNAVGQGRAKVSFYKPRWRDKIDVVYMNRERLYDGTERKKYRYIFKVVSDF